MNKHGHFVLSLLVVIAFLISASTSAAGTEAVIFDRSDSAKELNDRQRNSLNMLNYLALLTQEIHDSKNSRLYLEEAYSSLINNMDPNAIVDSTTLSQFRSLLDMLKSYQMISEKRDRLQYIYERNRALAFRKALPNPLGLLSVVQSGSLKKIAASLLYMAVDSRSSYEDYETQTDLQYLQDGWALDDEEKEALHNSRAETFSHMVTIVGEFSLPSKLALNEDAVDRFVDCKNNSNVLQKIQFLESSKETYRAFGAYWLVLAESYYSNNNYAKCIEAVAAYEALDIHIFRKDHQLAKILTLAVVSAGEVMEGADYIDAATQYVEKILANSSDDEWALRYFSAQTYVDLYARTDDRHYLKEAYDIALNNVNNLINDQETLNEKYLSEVQDVKIPNGATKEAKAQINNYNKLIRTERKKALAPIYEPLLLNCDLLFFLAKESDVSQSEKTRIEGILHQDGKNLFLVAPIDSLYRFAPLSAEVTAESDEIIFTGAMISLPAKYVSDDAAIKVTITEAKTLFVFEDWMIDKVNRKNVGDQGSFIAEYKSPAAEKHKYSAGATIQIEITPKKNSGAEMLSFVFKTENTKLAGIINKVVFRRVK